MGYVDKQLDQVQQMLAAGNIQGAHQLVKGIAMDEPANERAQALLAEATQRLQQMPPPQQYPPQYQQAAYQQPQYPPQPIYIQAPPKKRNTLGLVLITLIFGACAWIFFMSNSGGGGGGTRTTPGRSSFSSQPSTVNVLYEVTGTARRASLTYENGTGGTEQKNVTIPWKESLTVARGSFVYLSAQNDTQSGSVTCTIRVAGVIFKTSTSEGAYKIASCSGAAR